MTPQGHLSRHEPLSRVGLGGAAVVGAGGVLAAFGAVDASTWLALGLLPVAMAAAAGSDDEGGSDAQSDAPSEAPEAAAAPTETKRKKRKKKREPREKRPMPGAVSVLVQLIGFVMLLGCVAWAMWKDRSGAESLFTWVITATLGIGGFATIGYARERAGKHRAYAVPGAVKWIVVLVGALLALGSIVGGWDAALNDPAVSGMDFAAWSLVGGAVLVLLGLLQLRKA